MLYQKLMFHQSICYSFLTRKRSILLQCDSSDTKLVWNLSFIKWSRLWSSLYTLKSKVFRKSHKVGSMMDPSLHVWYLTYFITYQNHPPGPYCSERRFTTRAPREHQLIFKLNFIKTHFIDVMMHKLRGFHGLDLDLHLRQLDDWILQSDSRY